MVLFCVIDLHYYSSVSRAYLAQQDLHLIWTSIFEKLDASVLASSRSHTWKNTGAGQLSHLLRGYQSIDDR